MRDAGRRFAVALTGPVKWTTLIDYSNDGGQSWVPIQYVDGGITCSAKSQIRWVIDGMTVAGANVGRDELNPLISRFRVWHGIAGMTLLPMGIYKLTRALQATPSLVTISGASFETYMIAAPFGADRRFRPQSARPLVEKVIREVHPSAQIAWDITDDNLITPSITTDDRWGMLDGQVNSTTSIARALGARVYAGPSGNWVVGAVPSLADPPVWAAARGEVIVETSEELTDEGVANRYIVGATKSGDNELFPLQVAEDLDPLSDTYVLRSIDQGGSGPRTEIYRSELIKNRTQAAKVARAGLAERLGLRQQVNHTELHDPRREPGDVGIVETVNGPRLVLPDSITWDLTGAPMTQECRTTQTTLMGDVTPVPDEDEADVAS